MIAYCEKEIVGDSRRYFRPLLKVFRGALSRKSLILSREWLISVWKIPKINSTFQFFKKFITNIIAVILM